MADVITPKFQVPFRINRRSASYVEQGSIEEVMQCVLAVLKTPVGQREDAPEFGLLEQVFLEGGADLTEIRRAIQEFEPRASILSDQVLRNLLAEVNIKVRTDGSIS